MEERAGGMALEVFFGQVLAGPVPADKGQGKRAEEEDADGRFHILLVAVGWELLHGGVMAGGVVCPLQYFLEMKAQNFVAFVEIEFM